MSDLAVLEHAMQTAGTPPAGVELTPTGLVFDADLSSAEYIDIGAHISQLDHAAQSTLCWLYADWYARGDFAHGERSHLVESDDWTGPALPTLKAYATVARRCDPSARMPALSFAHHRAVIGLTVEDRQRVLRRAEDEKLSVRRTEDLAAAVLGKPPSMPRLQTVYNKDAAAAEHPPNSGDSGDSSDSSSEIIEAYEMPSSVDSGELEVDETAALDAKRAGIEVQRALAAWESFNRTIAASPLCDLVGDTHLRRFLRSECAISWVQDALEKCAKMTGE